MKYFTNSILLRSCRFDIWSLNYSALEWLHLFKHRKGLASSNQIVRASLKQTVLTFSKEQQTLQTSTRSVAPSKVKYLMKRSFSASISTLKAVDMVTEDAFVKRKIEYTSS